jgi:UDPglucose 6-dehydrogenase
MAKSNIGVVGLWHLGCVLCACWSRLGHKVVAVDFRTDLVGNLKDGVPPIFEPGLEDEIKRGLSDGLLSFSTDERSLNQCDFTFIGYDTPIREDDTSDVSPILEAVERVAPFLKDYSLVIVSSQSPVAFCSSLRAVLLGENPTLELVYSPENLRLGEAIHCYLNPGRIIVGGETDHAKEQATSLFSEIQGEVTPMTLASAEMVKHGINSFLATSITFANYLADACEYSGADILQVVKGMKSDPRIGTKAYLNPGIGFSGGTLGRDLRVLENLNRQNDGTAEFFGKIHRYNSLRKSLIVAKIERLLDGTAKNKKIGVLGVTYKPGTSTLRQSLPLEIVGLLQSRGAEVVVYDPRANFAEYTGSPTFRIAEEADLVFNGSDMVVLLSEWPEFQELNWQALSCRMRRPIVFDAKNALTNLNWKHLSIDYHGVGRR